MQTLSPEILRPPQAEQLRRYDDAATWASEVLNGVMRSSFEFTPQGDELYGHDGLPLSLVFENAIVSAELKAQEDPSLAFEVRRAKVERGELDDVLAMARGEGPNTMVVLSYYPIELTRATEDVGGYNHQRRQTMMRVIYRQPDGTIAMVSQSLEGSHREALEAIRESVGYQTQPGELLGQRMHLDLDAEDQEFLPDLLTGAYDRSLSEQQGGVYRAGWEVPTDRVLINTYDFVMGQGDLIRTFLDKGERNSSGLYGFAAAMQQRYEREVARLSNRGYVYTMQPPNFMSNPMIEMQQAAIEAKAERKVFSGCGASISANGELSTEQSLRELGYGSKSDEDKFGPLTFKCSKGHANRRPRAKSPKDFITNCQKCGISVQC